METSQQLQHIAVEPFTPMTMADILLFQLVELLVGDDVVVGDGLVGDNNRWGLHIPTFLHFFLKKSLTSFVGYLRLAPSMMNGG